VRAAVRFFPRRASRPVTSDPICGSSLPAKARRWFVHENSVALWAITLCLAAASFAAPPAPRKSGLIAAVTPSRRTVHALGLPPRTPTTLRSAKRQGCQLLPPASVFCGFRLSRPRMLRCAQTWADRVVVVYCLFDGDHEHASAAGHRQKPATGHANAAQVSIHIDAVAGQHKACTPSNIVDAEDTAFHPRRNRGGQLGRDRDCEFCGQDRLRPLSSRKNETRFRSVAPARSSIDVMRPCGQVSLPCNRSSFSEVMRSPNASGLAITKSCSAVVTNNACRLFKSAGLCRRIAFVCQTPPATAKHQCNCKYFRKSGCPHAKSSYRSACPVLFFSTVVDVFGGREHKNASAGLKLGTN